MIWDIIPCSASECDEYSQVNTTVSICRCSHLTRFGVVYQQTNVTQSSGVSTTPGIYSNFYAMQFWTTSFGYYCSAAGMIFFAIGHIFIMFIDKRLQVNLIVKLREKIRKFEQEHGGKMNRPDGLFHKSEAATGRSVQGKVMSKKKVFRDKDDSEGGGDKRYNLVNNETAPDFVEELDE